MIGLFHTTDDRERPSRGPGPPPVLRLGPSDAHTRMGGAMLRAALCACLDVAARLIIITWSVSNCGEDLQKIIIKKKTRQNKQTITFKNGDSDKSGGTMSKVQGGMKCVKYLLFVFNFIFWVSPWTVCIETALLCFHQNVIECPSDHYFFVIIIISYYSLTEPMHVWFLTLRLRVGDLWVLCSWTCLHIRNTPGKTARPPVENMSHLVSDWPWLLLVYFIEKLTVQLASIHLSCANYIPRLLLESTPFTGPSLIFF